MAIPIFADISDREFNNSVVISSQIVRNIKTQNKLYNFNKKNYNETKQECTKAKEQLYKFQLDELTINMTKDQKRANKLAQMKGASSWMNTLPLESDNNTLNKREFYDAISLRYRLELKCLALICACGKKYNVDHAMSCIKGGFIHQCHDEIGENLSKLTSEICNDVEIEPHLLEPMGEVLPRCTNKQKEARLDFCAQGFWQCGQRAYFDVRVFNPFSPSYQHQKLDKVFSVNERENKRLYNERVLQIEHGSFTPLVFTPNGGCSRETEKFIKTLSAKIAEKRDIAERIVTNWIRKTFISCYSVRQSFVLVDRERL